MGNGQWLALVFRALLPSLREPFFHNIILVVPPAGNLSLFINLFMDTLKNSMEWAGIAPAQKRSVRRGKMKSAESPNLPGSPRREKKEGRIGCGEGKRILLTAAVTILLAFATPILAAEYPIKPISLIIPYPAGGVTDITGRALAMAAQKHLGQPIIAENKAGGGGTVGPSLVVPRSPDGYTLGIMGSQTVTIAFHMGKINFNPLDDLTHIIRYSGYLQGLVVRADSPWKTLQDFVNYCKANPQKVSYGSSGVGTGVHLAMEDLASLAGIQLIHIPYKGGGEPNAALLGGHVDAVSDGSTWAPLVDSGKFRLLVTYQAERSTRYENVPTLKEAGYNTSHASPLEIMGPKGMPKPIVTLLHDAFKKAIDDPEYQAVLKKVDMPVLYLGWENLEEANRQESELIGRIVQKLGLQKK
jgi:tripartite-type tricarboxylate transporter receptor subunit TctC